MRSGNKNYYLFQYLRNHSNYVEKEKRNKMKNVAARGLWLEPVILESEISHKNRAIFRPRGISTQLNHGFQLQILCFIREIGFRASPYSARLSIVQLICDNIYTNKVLLSHPSAFCSSSNLIHLPSFLSVFHSNSHFVW